MLALIQTVLMTVLPFLAVLTLVITIHELGHFSVAKACGVKIDRFSIGFGRAVFSRIDKSGVEWRIGWIPLGGYVKFAGDADVSSPVPASEDLDQLRRQVAMEQGVGAVSRYIQFKPLWQRAAVVVAGPLANFLLAIVIFAALAMIVGSVAVRPKVGALVAGGPAAVAGLQVGDVVTRLDGAPIDDFRAIGEVVRMKTAEPLRFTVQRGTTTRDVLVTPTRHDFTDPLTGRVASLGYVGLSPSVAPGDIYRRHYNPIEAVGYGVSSTWDILNTTVTYLGRIVEGRESPSQLGSFVGMAQTSGGVAKEAMQSAPHLGGQLINLSLSLLALAAFLSVGIGFMNLLPIPVLDGGHLLFYAYEAVARRPAAARVQAAGYRVGLALLLGLMLFATWNDLHQIPVFKFLGGLFS